MMISILISFLSLQQASAQNLPSWITKGPMSDSVFHYVICSHDGIDPEEARQIAESKCLASAAKLGGVIVKLTQKTVQSLTGSDSSEVAEIQPLEVNVKCEWTNRFLEKIKDGFRVWLSCKVKKSEAKAQESRVEKEPSSQPKKHFEATVIVTTLPQADRIIIVSSNGERVIEPTSNIVSITVSESDQKLELSKLGYKKAVLSLPQALSHGERVSQTIIFEKN